MHRTVKPFAPRSAACAAAMLLAAAGAARAQYAIRVTPGDYTVNPGSPVTLPIEIESRDPVTGFSFGARHDDARLELVAVGRAAALNQVLGAGEPSADFYVLNQAPGGAAGFTVAAILGPQDASRVLAPGTRTIYEVQYRARTIARGEALVRIAGDLGTPPVALVIDVNGGTAKPFSGSSQVVRIVEGSLPFIRGDADANGSRNISDAVFILRFLFQGGAAGTCPAAMNVDGSVNQATAGTEDTLDVSLTDAVHLLNFLFNQGAAPAAPFPSCGQPSAPLAAAMACLQYARCAQ